MLLKIVLLLISNNWDSKIILNNYNNNNIYNCNEKIVFTKLQYAQLYSIFGKFEDALKYYLKYFTNNINLNNYNLYELYPMLLFFGIICEEKINKIEKIIYNKEFEYNIKILKKVIDNIILLSKNNNNNNNFIDNNECYIYYLLSSMCFNFKLYNKCLIIIEYFLNKHYKYNNNNNNIHRYEKHMNSCPFRFGFCVELCRAICTICSSLFIIEFVLVCF